MNKNSYKKMVLINAFKNYSVDDFLRGKMNFQSFSEYEDDLFDELMYQNQFTNDKLKIYCLKEEEKEDLYEELLLMKEKEINFLKQSFDFLKQKR